jgi:hypothetical protein
MDMVWASFHIQDHLALITAAFTLPLSMDVGPSSGSDVGVYHTGEVADALSEADAAEVSASGDGGGRAHGGVRRGFTPRFPDSD